MPSAPSAKKNYMDVKPLGKGSLLPMQSLYPSGPPSPATIGSSPGRSPGRSHHIPRTPRNSFPLGSKEFREGPAKVKDDMDEGYSMRGVVLDVPDKGNKHVTKQLVKASDDLKVSATSHCRLSGQLSLLTDQLESKLQAHSEKMDVLSLNVMDVLQMSRLSLSQEISEVTNGNTWCSQSSTVATDLAEAMQNLKQQIDLLSLNLQKHSEQMEQLPVTRSARSSTAADPESALQDQQKQMDLLHKQSTGQLHADHINLQDMHQRSKSMSRAEETIDDGKKTGHIRHGTNLKSNGTDSDSSDSEYPGIVDHGATAPIDVKLGNSMSEGLHHRSISHQHLSGDQTNLFYAQEVLASVNDLDSRQSQLRKIQEKLAQDAVAQSLMSMSFEREPQRNSVLAKIVKTEQFDYFSCLVIVANAVFIAVTTDLALKHASDEPLFFIITNICFQVWFLVEVLLKLYVHRWYFFVNKDKLWNSMDLALVFLGTFDVVLSRLGIRSNGGVRWAVFRSFRLVRAFKVLRLVRVVRFCSELRTMVQVLTASLENFFWSLILLFLIIFMFGIIFADGTLTYLGRGDVDDDKKALMLINFNSVLRSILTLLKTATGGLEWGPLADTLYDAGVLYYIIFIIFVLFTYLALMNILTGVFVDRTFKAVAADSESLALEHMIRSEGIVRDLVLLFCAMTGEDVLSESTIDNLQFQKCMSSPLLRARLAAIDLEIWDPKRFFAMLTSISNSEELNLRDWVTGCMQMRGHSSSIATAKVLSELKSVKRAIRRLEGPTSRGLKMQQSLCSELDACHGS